MNLLQTIGNILTNPAVIITLSAGAAIIYSSVTKRAELKEQKRQNKMSQYLSFLEKLILLKQLEGGNQQELEQVKVALAVNIQLLNLVANKGVVESANQYLNCLKPECTGSGMFTQEYYYNQLVLAMREDVYGKKHNKDMDEIITLLTIR
ncbi:MAG: hypothetical protein ACRDD4_08780 [Culicoidibacterales bacterium]